MGFFDRLKKAITPPASGDAASGAASGHAIAPSSEYPTAVDAIVALLSARQTWQWATFEADRADGKSAIIEVSGDEINTCTDEVDLPAIARRIGLDALAETIKPGGKRGDDRTLHILAGANAAELAELVSAVFIHHHRLPAEFSVEGYLQD